MQTAQTLLKLQDIDLDTMRARKALDELPQRIKILAIRKKRDEVTAKSAQAAELRENNDAQVTRLCEEDDQQEKRMADLDESIKSSDDYRVVTSLTRDLEGCAKRREKIAFELNGLEEKSKKIGDAEKQIADALARLEQQEAQFTKDFISEASVLKDTIQRLQTERDEIVGELDADMYRRYTDISAHKGGIAVSVFEGDHCSVCRVELPEGQVHNLLTGPVISECPHCHRIIITKPLDS